MPIFINALVRNLLPEGFSSGKVKVPKKVSDAFGLVDEELPLDGLVTLLLGLSFTAAYWSPFAMEQKFLVSNCKCSISHQQMAMNFIQIDDRTLP